MGIKTAGTLVAKTFTRAGLHVFGNVEYPSVIRGDHNSVQLMVSDTPMQAHTRTLDLLFPLDRLALDLHKENLRPGGAVVFDGRTLKLSADDLGPEILAVDLPMAEMAKAAGLTAPASVNSIGLGAVQGLLRFDFETFARSVREALKKLKPAVLEKNLLAARQGYDRAAKEFAPRFDIALEERDAPRRMLLTGNDALSMGALKAGLKVYAGYPMTPSSSILNFMARVEREYGLVVKHTEDEISAIGTAIGAAHGGVRAMTATSGGGFSLMTEHLGLAGITETPLVVAECQRTGPSTGLPTRTEQADLKFVLSASQGDFPRIVIAPGDPEECFRWGFEAFNLAERFQTPVILLLDKHLSESIWTVEPFESKGMKVDRGALLDEAALLRGGEYKRHALTATGISPRSRPGLRGGVFRTTGDAHDEFGRITEDEEPVRLQAEKRLHKIQDWDVSVEGLSLYGKGRADVTLVGWGSSKGVMLEAADRLEGEGIRCLVLQVRFMNPFPAAFVAGILGEAKNPVLVEHSATGQLGDRIAETTGIRLEKRLLKYTGRQFMTDELAERIREIL
jgi:2-oxoglutarate ferredoxin oxidoreductase subunit alpha